MKKILILLTLTMMVTTLSAQIRPKIGGAKADSLGFKDDNWTSWITGISDALAGNSTRKLVTEYGVKNYLSTFAPSGINVSVDSLADTTARHLLILLQLGAVKHSHSNLSILNANTASFTPTLSTAISTATSTNTIQGDSLTSHNTRIKANKTSINGLDTRIDVLEANPAAADIKLSGVPVSKQVLMFIADDSTAGVDDVYHDFTNHRFGVGVATPASKMHIDGGAATTTYYHVTIGATTGQTAADGGRWGLDINGKLWFIQNEALDLGFSVNTTERLTLTATTGIRVKDDIFYENLNPVTSFGYIYIDSATNQCFVDSSYILGAAGLVIDLPSIASLIKETNSDGEIRWPFPNYEGGVDWLFPNKNMQYGIILSSHQVMMEVLLRKIDEQDRKNEDLEDRLSEEAKYRESLEKRFNQLEKDVSLLKHKSLKRQK